MKIIADENIPYVEPAFKNIGSVSTMPGRKISNRILADADMLLFI